MRHLSMALGRPIAVANGWIIQLCPICEVELRLLDSLGWPERLDVELFSLFDDHRCRAPATEDTFQRAERASVLAGECALLIADIEPELAKRAELESLKLARWVDAYRRDAA